MLIGKELQYLMQDEIRGRKQFKKVLLENIFCIGKGQKQQG